MYPVVKVCIIHQQQHMKESQAMTNAALRVEPYAGNPYVRFDAGHGCLDLAATSCICELTEKSVRSGSKPVSIPDFTRGNWRNVKPWGVVNIDITKMGL